MKVIEIPVWDEPRIVDVSPDERGSFLGAYQELVGGLIEAVGVPYGNRLTLYVNEEGIPSGLAPNRAVFASKWMEERGFLSCIDYETAVREGDLYTVLFGTIVAVAADPVETVEDGCRYTEWVERDVTEAEFAEVEADFADYATGINAVAAIRCGRTLYRPPLPKGAW